MKMIANVEIDITIRYTAFALKRTQGFDRSCGMFV